MRQNDTLSGYLLPHLLRYGVIRVAGQITSATLTTVGLTANRQYFVPFTTWRKETLTSLGFAVTSASAGSASIGVYDTVTDATYGDVPQNLLASVTGLDTGTTGNKFGTVSLILDPGKIYWASLICSAGPTVRVLPAAGLFSAFGAALGATTPITALFAFSTDSSLINPVTASDLFINTTVPPVIYLTTAV